MTSLVSFTVNLFADNLVDMNDPLSAVDTSDLAFTALVDTTDNLDFVVLSNGDGASLDERN